MRYIILVLFLAACTKEDQPKDIYAEKCDQSGQVDSLGIPMYLICIPNVFTPNGDGINDEFSAKGVGLENGYSMEIFDRDKGRVFLTSDINKAWTGAANGAGEIAPAGAYHYLVSFIDSLGTKHSYTGQVMMYK
jgi:gliding motility-associated-like protein